MSPARAIGLVGLALHMEALTFFAELHPGPRTMGFLLLTTVAALIIWVPIFRGREP